MREMAIDLSVNHNTVAEAYRLPPRLMSAFVLSGLLVAVAMVVFAAAVPVLSIILFK